MFSNLKALPYPVLGRSDDFIDSDFQTAITTEVIRDETGERVQISYNFMCSNEEITELIEAGKASYSLDIRCVDTLYRMVHFLNEDTGVINFDVGDLYGKVVIEPCVVIKVKVKNFFAKDLHPEFDGTTYELEVGDQIAVDAPAVRFIEFDRLRFESLVKIELSEDVDTNTYQVDLSGDQIIIYMGEKMRTVWDINWQDKEKAPFLALSVYKDVVLAALEVLSNNEEESDERKWGRALKQKIVSAGIRIPQDADFHELNPIAQRLVSRHGVQRILKNVT